MCRHHRKIRTSFSLQNDFPDKSIKLILYRMSQSLYSIRTNNMSCNALASMCQGEEIGCWRQCLTHMHDKATWVQAVERLVQLLMSLKGLFIKFPKFNPILYGSNGLRIWSFKKFHRRISPQMSIIGCARAVRLRAFSPVFAQSAIPIYTQVCNIKGQISARVQLYNPQTTSL